MSDEEEPPPVQQSLTDGEIVTVDIEDEVQRSYLDYAMSVIVGRALPDVRDGLKPVHRRILWGMLGLGARPGVQHLKCARVVGEVMGKYHPHGDQAIYDALARMAQDFAMRYPLVDGKGNFGSVDGDPPAAQRYCVTGDTLVRTAHGTVPMATFARIPANSEAAIGRKVLDHHGNPVLATRFFHSGDHPTFRVRTAEGHEITGTANHPLLCLEPVAGVPTLQWRTIDEIEPGTWAVMLREQEPTGPPVAEADHNLGLLAGALVSEGLMAPGRAGFSSTDTGFFNAVLGAYDAVVGGPRSVTCRALPSGRALHELDIHNLDALAATPFGELIGRDGATTRVPTCIWAGSPEVKRSFLRALLEGHGSIGLGRRNRGHVWYATRNPALAQDLLRLLLEFGVVARWRCNEATGEYRVLISNRREVRLFERNVGFLAAKRRRLADALATVPLTSRAVPADHIPFVAAYLRSVAGRGGREWLKGWERDGDANRPRIFSDEALAVIEPLVSGRYHFARVASKHAAGVQPVYSIRVDSDAHSFVANGFVNHNTECRLSPLAMELLRDIDEDTVDFIANYDGREEEPSILPSRFPNLLVNGSTGIAVGMATNIPPHNLGEVIDATIALIDNAELTSEDLMKIIRGPDFPGGGSILGRAGVKDAYETGRGSIRVRGQAEIEETKRGQRIVITQLPYMVSGDRLLEKIKELVDAKRVTGISGGRNESSRKGMRIIVDLKRDAIPQVVLNNLYKFTQLQDSFGMNMLALVDGVPRTLPLVEILRAYLTHQVEVLTRRTRFRLRKAEDRMHVLAGLLIALDHLDAVITLIREAPAADEARAQLMSRDWPISEQSREILARADTTLAVDRADGASGTYRLSETQATAILDMMLRRLAGLERQKLRDEAAELAATIAELRAILDSPTKLRRIIKDEMQAIRDKFANERRTQIIGDEGEFDIEDLIPDEDVVITITRSGYIKRTKSAIYKLQGRGGKGVIGAKPKEGDIVSQVLTTTNHAFVLVFSTRGKVYRIKAHEIPEKERTSRGISIRNILPFTPEESVAAVIDTRDFETHKYLVIATTKGIIKKTEFTAYNTSRRDGIIALTLREDDEVEMVKATSGDDELIMVSRKGMSIRFSEADVRPMGRTAGGVIAMRLDEEDVVVDFDVVDPNAEVLIVTDGGYGKRTLLSNFPSQHRGGKGVIAIKLPGKRGFVAGAYVVWPGNEVFLIASDGQVIRMEARAIARQGRDTTGVRVMRLDPGVSLVGLAPVNEE